MCLQWCEQDQRCKRLQLTDMLVAPMQHCTKLPLLLARIKKDTENVEEKQQLSESIDKTEKSLRELKIALAFFYPSFFYPSL